MIPEEIVLPENYYFFIKRGNVHKKSQQPPGFSSQSSRGWSWSRRSELPVCFCGVSEMCSQTKAAAVMANIPQTDIDPSGVFKYVLIRVHSREEGDDSEVDIVRGYGWAEFHGDIYDKVSAELEEGGLLDCECIGGGRIKHDPNAKKIHVYGYSIGFGRANHAVTTEKVKHQYPDYEVTWDNEGY